MTVGMFPFLKQYGNISDLSLTEGAKNNQHGSFSVIQIYTLNTAPVNGN